MQNHFPAEISAAREEPSKSYLDLYDSVYRNDLSTIPLEAIGPSKNFGEDHLVHRSIGDFADKGGLEVLSASSSFNDDQSHPLAGSRYAHNRSFVDNYPLKRVPMYQSTTLQDIEDDRRLSVVDVPSIPCFLEPNNHIYLNAEKVKPLQVARLLEGVFGNCQVDYYFKPEMCKWKAARRKHHISVDFRARIYRCEAKQALVVEFQRRQGDIFLMRDIFERFLTALEDAKLDIDYPSTCIQPCAPSTHSFAPTTPDTSGMQLAHQAAVSPFVIGSGVYLPPAFYTRPSPEALASLLPLAPSTLPPTQDEKAHKPWKSDEGDEKTENGLADLIDPLLIMASSECSLQQREAALALAQLSANESSRSLLKDAGAIPILVELIKGKGNKCPAVRQAVLTALSNLSESPSCKARLVEAGILPNLLDLTSPINSAVDQLYRELETRRDSARTLANLTEEYATALVGEVGKEALLDWLRTIEAVQDERILMHARRVKRYVGAACC